MKIKMKNLQKTKKNLKFSKGLNPKTPTSVNPVSTLIIFRHPTASSSIKITEI